MSAGPRIPLAHADQLAAEIVRLLSAADPQRIEIAGSIRRRKQDVGDIEIILQAKDDRIDRLCDDLVASQTFGEPRLKVTGARVSWGSRYKATTIEGVKLDIFIVRPTDSWGVQFLLRTGSGEANKCLVTARRFGGCMPAGIKMAEGWLWRDAQRLHTPEEVDVFRAVGLPWVEPSARTPQTYLDLLASPPAPNVLMLYTHFGPGGTPRERFLAELCDGSVERRAYFRRRAEEFLSTLSGTLGDVEREGKRVAQLLQSSTLDDDARHAAESRRRELLNRYRTLRDMAEEAELIVSIR